MKRQARTPRHQPENRLPHWRTVSRCLLAAVICTSSSGCKHFLWWQSSHPYGPNARRHIDSAMSQEHLIGHVNTNVAKLSGWTCSSAKIKASGMPVGVTAMIAVEKPRNFRLIANNPITGSQLADMGSNDEQFWFWNDDKRQPDLILCNHTDVSHASQVLPIPFEPDWLMEVMGLRELEVDAHTVMQERDGFLEVLNKRISPSGQPVTKQTVISRRHGIVLEYRLLDAGGRMIAQAMLSQHVEDAASGAVIPSKIELDWPQAQMRMTITLEHPTVNPGPAGPAQFQVPQNMSVRQIAPPRMSRELDNSYEEPFQQTSAPDYDYEQSGSFSTDP